MLQLLKHLRDLFQQRREARRTSQILELDIDIEMALYSLSHPEFYDGDMDTSPKRRRSSSYLRKKRASLRQRIRQKVLDRQANAGRYATANASQTAMNIRVPLQQKSKI